MIGPRRIGLFMLLGYGGFAALVVALLMAMVGVDCSGAWCAPWLLFEVAVFLVCGVVLLVTGLIFVPTGYALLRFGKASNVRIVFRRGSGAGHGGHPGHPGHPGQGGNAGHPGQTPHGHARGPAQTRRDDVIDVEARDVKRD